MPTAASRSVVRSSLLVKLGKVRQVISDNGFRGLLSETSRYLKYHIHSKWHFVYFEYSLDQPVPAFTLKGDLAVRLATPDDRPRIESDLFPLLTGEFRYERRYFERLGEKDMLCFLAEMDGRLVHYSWVFTDVFKSILMDVPIDEDKLGGRDAFIGPVFTDPAVRGFLVYPFVLTTAMRYLRDNQLSRRVIIFVAGGNPTSIGFYNRLGFKEVPNLATVPPWSFLDRR